ncbi:MAG: hypothetical protein ACXVJB_12975 [Mucilaginibacter sp.]
MKTLYVSIGYVLIFIAIAFLFLKVPVLTDPHAAVAEVDPEAVNIVLAPAKKLYQHRHFMWAVIAQLFNVAAQGSTWAFFITYGHDVMGFSNSTAGEYMILFMAIMALGRFAGTI